MNIYYGSTAYKILKVLSLCGEYPYSSLDLLGINHRWAVETLNKLKKAKYVSVSGKGKRKGIRLLKSGYAYIAEMGDTYKQQYNAMTDGEYISTDWEHTWKRQRVAETMLLMERAKIIARVGMKPALKRVDALPYLDGEGIKGSFFYTPKELKSVAPEEMDKIRGARMTGLCVLQSGIYSVYNISDGGAFYKLLDDGQMRALIQRLVKPNGWRRASERDIETLGMRSIVVGRNVDAGVKLIEENLKNGKHLAMELGEAFTAAHFVPLNDIGVGMLHILQEEDFSDRLIDATISYDVRVAAKAIHVAADGYDVESKTYVLVLFDSDLKKLKQFALGIYGQRIAQERCQVACFEWQEPIVRSVLPGAAVQTFDMGEIERQVFGDGKAGSTDGAADHSDDDQ